MRSLDIGSSAVLISAVNTCVATPLTSALLTVMSTRCTGSGQTAWRSNSTGFTRAAARTVAASTNSTVAPPYSNVSLRGLVPKLASDMIASTLVSPQE
jgi:hypothetical protein